MKKLDLKALRLTSGELLQRKQLMKIFGGYPTGGDMEPGDYNCCTVQGTHVSCGDCVYLENPENYTCSNGGILGMCVPQPQLG